MADLNEFTLRISETANVRPGTFRANVSVVFAGKISEDIYSLAILWSFGHNSMAYNLYLDKKDSKIFIPKGILEIVYLSDKEIRLRYLNR